jgi:hypothetical protein
MDFERRKGRSRQVQSTVVDDCPVAFVYGQTFHESYSAKVSNAPACIRGLIDGITGTSIRT